MEKLDKVLEKLQVIEIQQAVTNEQLKELHKNLRRGETRFNRIDERLEKVDNRLDFHDKVVGSIVFCAAIIGTLIRLKIL